MRAVGGHAPESAAGVLLTGLVLVGVPLGVLVVGRATAPPPRHASQQAMVARQIRAQLAREGVKHVRCGWTSDPAFTVSCSGTRDDGSTEGDQEVIIRQPGAN